jgi:hypothetical protein
MPGFHFMVENFFPFFPKKFLFGKVGIFIFVTHNFQKRMTIIIQPVQHNVWYHNTVTWDKNTGTVTLVLKERDYETTIGTYSIDGFTSFSPSMVNLGTSWVGHNASNNQTISYLDNMIFYEKTGP